tara:strand:- start:2578 stop:3072 length:495 start_codon:yes stop_codon:yes gene_type:complete
MKSLLILILGIFLLNTFFSFIPVVSPDTELATYFPYQCWFNIILIFSWLLPTSTAQYLFDKKLQSIASEKESSESSNELSSEQSTETVASEQSTEPVASEQSTEPVASAEPVTESSEAEPVASAPPAEPVAPPTELSKSPAKGGSKSPKIKKKRKKRTRKRKNL